MVDLGTRVYCKPENIVQLLFYCFSSVKIKPVPFEFYHQLTQLHTQGKIFEQAFQEQHTDPAQQI